VTLWAMLENINASETLEELDRVAANCAAVQQNITADQWGRVVAVGQERRKTLQQASRRTPQ
jgi:hypothetical protein